LNSRDVGGLRTSGGAVRPGLLLRSDAPLRLDRPTVARLGLRTAIDLREPVERELDPLDLALDVREVPILGELDAGAPGTLLELYREVLELRGAQLASAVRVLCEPRALPAIVFCSAGKDRTGLVLALALSAVGVLDDEIAADYGRSEEAMRGAFRATLEQRARAAGISEQALAVKLGAPRALMCELLEWLREEHGGALRYLERHGLGETELAALRSRLIVSSPSARLHSVR
jgi:protein-tyrosine phosphatase